MNKNQRIIAVLIAFILVLEGSSLSAQAAEVQYRMNIAISVDGMEMGYIPAFDDTYENNLYISLRGLAYALRETDKAFVPVVEKRKISITSGAGDVSPPSLWDAEALSTTGRETAGRREITLDGAERKYYSYILLRDESYDAFMNPVCLAMMFDLDMTVTDGGIEIDTREPFSVTAEELEESGYLQGVNALVIGDGTTGEIFYQYDKDEPVPIASTTKLMTYLVLMDAVSRGECSIEDTVVISENAEKLSNGSDGVLPMQAGTKVPLRELVYGMLLPSSNECALAVAEYVAGSQEAFVERMNAKAAEMGWTNAKFYNCHGLPCFEDQLIPAKIHNHMTAEEMFRLASVIMDTYPQVTEYTTTKAYYLKNFGTEVKNTNAVLYNMENVMGLKTGTTNKAGACLVTCVAAEKDGQNHNLITVLFGAEGDANRGIVSEMAARYAVTALQEWQPQDGDAEGESGGIPQDPEMVVEKLIQLQVSKNL